MTKVRSKFNVSADVEKRTFEGVVYDSVLEMRYFKEVLKPLIDTGEIVCDKQVKFVLQPSFKRDGKTVHSIDYVADFVITRSGVKTVVDTKGIETPVSIIKKKMFWSIYPDIELQLIGYSLVDGGFVPLEKIKQGRKARKKLKEIKEKKDSGKKEDK